MTVTESIQKDLEIIEKNAQQLSHDYNEEANKHSGLLNDMKVKASAEISSLRSREQTELEREEKNYNERIELIKTEVDTIRQIDGSVNVYYPRQKVDFSNAPRGIRYNAQEAIDLLNKIAEHGFLAWIKKLLSIRGYKSNHDMALEVYSAIDSALAYYDSEKKNARRHRDQQKMSIESSYQKKIDEVNRNYNQGVSRENTRYQSRVSFLNQQKTAYLSDPHYDAINQKRSKAAQMLLGSEEGWKQFTAQKSLPSEVLLGQLLVPSTIKNPDSVERELLGKCCNYVGKLNSFSVPFSHLFAKSILLYIETDASTNLASDIFRNIVLRQIRFMPPKSFKALFADPVNRGRSMGSLIHFTEQEGGCGVCDYCLSGQDISQKMKNLTNHVDNVCRKLTSLGCADINEYNARVKRGRINYSTLVIHDFPNGFDAASLDALSVVISQARQCGISVMISRKQTDKLENKALELVQNIQDKFIVISTVGSDAKVRYNNQTYRFRTNDVQTSSAFFDDFNSKYLYKPPIDNNFSTFFAADHLPQKRSAIKGLDIPFAVDQSGKLIELKIGYDLSAYGFINGSVGSGKTTLLHTIITSAAIHYPPDELEMWLVDYKVAEFAFYTNHCPPNIKYVVTDKSSELTYSVIDAIDAEIDRREQLFVHASVKDYEAYRSKHQLPKVLIIIDEFHRMSQAASMDGEYKTKLENIFKEARSHGISILLCDQSFEGLRGLPDDAKKLIAVRIAMRNDAQEIRTILGISGSGIDEGTVKLIKDTSSGAAGSLIYKHELEAKEGSYSYDVVYDGCRALYASASDRIAIIDKLIQTVSKPYESIFFMGAQRYPFNRKTIQDYEMIAPKKVTEGDRFYIGSPLGMGQTFYFNLEQSSGENLIMAGSNLEMRMSILKSIIQCAIRYSYHIVLLVPHTVPMYKNNRGFFDSIPNSEVYTSFPDICRYIGEQANKLKDMSTGDDFEDDDDFQEDDTPTIALFINPEDIYEKMDNSLLKQKDAWTVQPAVSSTTDAMHGGGMSGMPSATAKTSENHVVWPDITEDHPADMHRNKDSFMEKLAHEKKNLNGKNEIKTETEEQDSGLGKIINSFDGILDRLKDREKELEQDYLVDVEQEDSSEVFVSEEGGLGNMIQYLDDLLDSLDQEKAMIVQENSAVDIEFQETKKVDELFAGSGSDKIRGYNATADWGLLVSKGYRNNIHSFLFTETAMVVKKMREIKLEGNFNHRIALKMSQDEASLIMNSTRVMKSLIDSDDDTCAVYEYRGGREQCFRPYTII